MSRVQLALNVNDIEEAVSFYTKLFGTEPAKRKPGYANFAITEPPLKPKKDAAPEDFAAWDAQRHQQSSERICVEHANAEHKQWRSLQRFLGRREDFDETYVAVAGLVSDRAAER